MSNPTLLQMPLAVNGDKNTIPIETGSNTGLFSQKYGFQSINSLPLSAGGKAISRHDYNGAMYLLSNILFYAQKGYTFEFDSTQDYFTGCEVIDSTDGNKYRCIADVAAEGDNPSEDTTHWERIFNESAFFYRMPSTTYVVGDVKYAANMPSWGFLTCIVGGEAGSGELVIPAGTKAGDTITDGQVVWRLDSLTNMKKALVEATGYGIVSGCEPSISGLTVTVGAGVTHLADGTRKEIASTNITLDAADSTNPRIDLVYIDSTGMVAKVTGTASATPSAPSVPTGGISVCNVSVAANASVGTILYDAKTVTIPLPFFVSMDKFTELGRLQHTSGYDSTQGMCYNSKTRKLIVAEIKSDNSEQILHIVEPSTLAVESSYTYTALHHCNQMTYNPYTNKIITCNANKVIDADTMQILDETIPFSGSASSICYDYVKRVYVCIIYPGFNKSTDVLTYDLYDDDFNFIKRVRANIPKGYGVLNGADAHDGHLIFTAFDGFFEVDYYGHLLSVITTGTKEFNNHFTDLEFEDIAYIGDGNYVTNLNLNQASYGKISFWNYNIFTENYDTVANHLLEKISYDSPKCLYNKDLNDLVLAGKYYAYIDISNIDDAPGLHYPVDIGGNYTSSGFIEVLVLENDIVKQIFRRHGDGAGAGKNSYEVYTRQLTRAYAVWTDWERIDGLRAIPKTSGVNISGITTGLVTYTATCDGYLRIECRNTTNLEIYVEDSYDYHWRGPLNSGALVAGMALIRRGQTAKILTDSGAVFGNTKITEMVYG